MLEPLRLLRSTMDGKHRSSGMDGLKDLTNHKQFEGINGHNVGIGQTKPEVSIKQTENTCECQVLLMNVDDDQMTEIILQISNQNII